MVARALSDEKIQAIMADPPLVWRVVSPGDVDFISRKQGKQSRQDFLKNSWRKAAMAAQSAEL